MEQLPDEMVLAVMQHLPLVDLVACRAVSKGFAKLALRREVWHHRQIEIDRNSPCACPALRLAPCLDKLWLTVPLKRCAMLAATTACAVEKLALAMPTARAGSSEAALLIRHQSALGRLRHLFLSCFPLDSSECSWMLFSTMASISGLETLAVSEFPFEGAVFAPRRPVSTPSLRLFECQLLTGSQPFVDFMLAGHAATLEVVELGEYATYSPETVSLLAALPNLRMLQCPMLVGLEALASQELLTQVHLVVNYDAEMPAAVLSAAEFLGRAAKQLRKVTLRVEDTKSVKACVGLLKVLAHEKAQVTSLTLWGYPCKETHKLQRMFSLLTSLPALRKLKLEDLGENVRPTCVHAWLHWDTLKALMSANPSLRIKFFCDIPKLCQEEPCDVCALGCGSAVTSVCPELVSRIEVDRTYLCDTFDIKSDD